MTRNIISGAIVVVAAAVITTGSSAGALSLFGHNVTQTSTQNSITSTASTVTSEPCLHFQNHEYEVCTAYVANSSLAVLVPYYAYAKSPNTTLARYVQYRLGSRYSGQAYNLLANRVAGWPAGNHDVGVPDIRILSVSSSLQTNLATLVTQESWRVTTESGRVIYQEANARRTITMQKVPSYLLHKWVVTNIQ